MCSNIPRAKVLKIVRDEEGCNPREWDNLGRMYCWHRNYKLGDEPYNLWTGKNPQEVLDELPKGSIVLPLYLMDHSGISMSTGAFSCPWDSGQVGYIVATPEKIREAYMVKRITKTIRERATECLKQEVKTYDDYIRGNCWGFVVEYADNGEHVDSCFGFLGDDKEGIAEHLDDDVKGQLDQAWENRS